MFYRIVYLINNQKVSEKEWEAAFDRADPCVILSKQYIPIYHTLNLRVVESSGANDRLCLFMTNDDSVIQDSYN